MIPKRIHSVWLGGGELPPVARRCMASWRACMPDWEYAHWDEESVRRYCERTGTASPLDIPYVRQACQAGRYAFASDAVRLWALREMGGVYLDVDFEVYRSFETLLGNEAFAGYEGSKRSPVMMGVIASEADGVWVSDLLRQYEGRGFLLPDGTMDLTTNTLFFTRYMQANGLVCDGREQVFNGLHIYPVDYFSPRLTTGEYRRTERTFCEHCNMDSWGGGKTWKSRVAGLLPHGVRAAVIKLKRKWFG